MRDEGGRMNKDFNSKIKKRATAGRPYRKSPWFVAPLLKGGKGGSLLNFPMFST
jgi:hypothetical protein